MAGVAMATTGLGACHAIGHALGGRFDVAHGVALCLVLPEVLSFSLPACRSLLADLAFALGAGATAATAEENAVAAVAAVAALAESVGMTYGLADFGITSDDFAQIAADALDDEVIANAPVKPTATDITRMLAAVA
jgi:alcohol dehydrogenase